MTILYTTTHERPVKTRQCKPKHQRQLKVRASLHAYQLNQQTNQRTPIAEILLKGKWLIEAGFTANSRVNVQVKRGKLVITAE